MEDALVPATDDFDKATAVRFRSSGGKMKLWSLLLSLTLRSRTPFLETSYRSYKSFGMTGEAGLLCCDS
jgi:hypothetical protein